MEALVVHLKQHSPLLHFQYSHYGATLRVSEVKPKLDKFLKKKFPPDVWDRYKIKDTEALNYKLSISAHGQKCELMESIRDRKGKFVTRKFPFVLINMGGKESKEELVNFSFYSKITLTFLSKEEGLLKMIQPHLDAFFALHNFGNRQDKGFGSFYRLDADSSQFEKAIKEAYKGGPIYKKEVSNASSFYDLFNSLEKDYKKLKSGMRGTCCLKKYAQNKGIEWEKTAIKNRQEGRDIPQKACYLRAVLGVTNAMPYPRKKQIVKIDSDEVKRFASPILFKIFNNAVYAFSHSEIPLPIKGKEFTFSITDEDTGVPLKEAFNLSVPSFDLKNFMSYGFPKLGWEELKRK